jgi:hypothetical protein
MNKYTLRVESPGAGSQREYDSLQALITEVKALQKISYPKPVLTVWGPIPLQWLTVPDGPYAVVNTGGYDVEVKLAANAEEVTEAIEEYLEEQPDLDVDRDLSLYAKVNTFKAERKLVVTL